MTDHGAFTWTNIRRSEEDKEEKRKMIKNINKCKLFFFFYKVQMKLKKKFFYEILRVKFS